MSKIVHGASDEIRPMKATKPRQVDPSELRRATFSVYTIEGSIDAEELQTKVNEARVSGIRETEQKLAAPLNAALENVEKFMDELTRFRRELFQESENDILEMITTVAKKVVLKELSIDPSLLKEVVQKAISVVERERNVVIAVSPQDCEFYQKAKPDFLAKFQGIQELRIEVDRQLPSGQVFVRTQTLELDVRVDAMVDQLMQKVQDSRKTIIETNDEGDKA